ncbi:hypothetical protein BH10ACT6_BH10ACT6_01970 [soil metagenome]
MTTYQDPPLHSRRAARQGERADAQNTSSAASSAEQASAAGTAEPLNYATTSRPPLPQYDGPDSRPRRTVESTDHAGLPPVEALPSQDQPSYRPRDFSPEGRRSQPSWGPQYGGVGDDGTVEFHTQGREDVPVVAPEGNALTDAAPQPVTPTVAATPPNAPVQQHVEQHVEHTMTRRELRALREAGLITDVTDLSQPIFLPVAPSIEPQPVAEAVVVDAPVAEPTVAGVHVAEAPVAPVEVPAAVAPIADPIPLVAPTPQHSTRLDSALAEFDALASGREPLAPEADAPAPLTGRRSAGSLLGEPSAVDSVAEAEIEAEPENEDPAPWAAPSVAELFPQPEPLPPSTEGLSAFDALFQPPSAAIPVVFALPLPADVDDHEVIEAQIEPDREPPSEPDAVVQPLVDPLVAAPAPQGVPAAVPPPAAYPTPVDLPAPPATQSPVADQNLFPVTVPLAAGTPGSTTPVVPPVDAVTPAEPPVGHWTTQAGIDDAEQVNETAISRSLGAGNTAITTSALVLPSVPDAAFGGPLGEGGEILLTGSISLPESLSSLGAHPSQLDESDLDHLLDPGDHQVANTDSTPVRAIRAVSTHTASGGIISPTKPKGTRGFTVLIIAASAMAVVVVGLLIAGLVSGAL